MNVLNGRPGCAAGSSNQWTTPKSMQASRKTGLAMAFKLMMSAQKEWRKPDGQNRPPEIIQGVVFRYGIKHLQTAA
ncbi:hypothetical protein ABIE69_002823 [Rhodobacteraceae bacterium MBR-64]